MGTSNNIDEGVSNLPKASNVVSSLQTPDHSTNDSRDLPSDKTIGPVQVKEYGSDDSSSNSLKEVFDVKGFDPVLAKKMALVNEAIDSIGMTNFQWKMFFLNGFGYAVDSVCPLSTIMDLLEEHVD